MKLHRIYKRVFLILSIITLVGSILCFYFTWNSLANFLLGLFASTFIIFIESVISYNIELKNTLIPYLKEIDSSLFNIEHFAYYSLDLAIIDYDNSIKKVKKSFENLNTNLSILVDMNYLNDSLRDAIVNLNNMFVELYKRVYMIFRVYYEVDVIDKRFLYIELYNILQGVNSENRGHSKYRHSFYEIVNKVDFIEYIRINNLEVKEDIFNDIEMKVSKDIFLAKIKEKNRVEYKSLKSKFDINDSYEKIKKKS